DGSVDFTTLGLTPGQFIWVGGISGSAFAFPTAAYTGFAQVSPTQAITPALLPLRRRAWTVGAADPGTGKTIDLYFTRWLRNVATTHPDYQEQSYHLELSLSSIGPGGATEYVNAQGQQVASFEITAALASLVKTSLSFVGTNVTDPSVNRVAGPAAAMLPLLVDRFTSTNEPYIQVVNAATEAKVCTDVTS